MTHIFRAHILCIRNEFSFGIILCILCIVFLPLGIMIVVEIVIVTGTNWCAFSYFARAHSTTPINWDFRNTFWRSNTIHMSKNDNFVCALFHYIHAWVRSFFLVCSAWMITYSKRKTCSPQTDRYNKRFYAEHEKLFEINETVLANLNDSFFYWKTFLFLFCYNVFLGSPNFGGHRLIVSCEKSSDRLFSQAQDTHNKTRLSWKYYISLISFGIHLRQINFYFLFLFTITFRNGFGTWKKII